MESRTGLAQRAARQVRERAKNLAEGSAEPKTGEHLTVIEAEAPQVKVELRELWRARETALMFAWRDVKVRYKQSLIGITWAILQPLMSMVVFTIIFGKFAKFPSQNQHYQVFVYTGLLPWMFFSTALTQISNSVLSNRQLVQKVYFPRLILPLSGVLVPAVDFLFANLVLIGLMIWYRIGVGWDVLFAPVFLLILVVSALGVGATFATVMVRFRDVPYVVPFVVQIWLYLSPVLYASGALPHKWQLLLSFNPVVVAITGFRWSVLGTPPPSSLELEAGLPTAAVMIALGFWIYRRWESRFADTI